MIRSWSGYNDELAWAAAWLYRATKQSNYLNKAVEYYNKIKSRGEVFSWDDKSMGVYALLAQLTNKQEYKQKLNNFCDWMRNNQKKSPKGQLYFQEWGSLRYSANAAFICLRVGFKPYLIPLEVPIIKLFLVYFKAADMGIDKNDNTKLARGQLDYILGSSGRRY